MKTKDGYLIHPGMWVYNTNGVYEIKEIRPTSILISEIEFDSDDSDGYGYSDTYTVLPREIRNNYKYA